MSPILTAKKEVPKLKKTKILVYLIIMTTIIIIGLMTAILYVYNKDKERKIFSNVESQLAYVNKYTVYGTHLNISGTIQNLDAQNVNEANLIFKINQNDETSIRLDYKIQNNELYFTTSNLINTGINLETIEENKYYIFIEIKYNEETKYYSLSNKTEYENIEYYTITKNKTNKKINIKFNTYNSSTKSLEYMQIVVKKASLPNDVYDIVIDAGHGGSDVGAQYKEYNEADLTIKYALELKEKLEKLGLKVQITRDGTEDKNKESKFNVYSVYDEDGRVNIVGKSKAKYMLSIHFNSRSTEVKEGGLEIYSPAKADLTFAQKLAKNIIETTKTKYSPLNTYKVENGVYVRTFKEEEIEEAKKQAEKLGYEPYSITLDTVYYYMIRETGGILTGAYIDGRNPKYGKNQYYNSNIGVESYLLELGYIVNEEDLNNILTKENLYTDGICKTIEENLLK